MDAFTLNPVNGRKSFYGKCGVSPYAHKPHVMALRSYNTIVAEYNTRTKKAKIFGWYSNTTAAHINAFLAFYGLPTMNKQEIQAATVNE